MDSIAWAAVIPAYNAAGTIASVITGVSAYIPRQRILVVDDGSGDDTAAVAESCRAELLRRDANGGKGRALRDGFRRVLQWQPDWVLCLDADAQHDPQAIPLFQQAAAGGHYDLLVGNRRRQSAAAEGFAGEMPLMRRLSNRISSGLLSLRTGVKLPDVQCGFRAVKAQALARMHLRADNYDIEAEMILQAWRLHLRIGWVAVPTVYGNEPSFIRKFPETIRFLKLLLRSFHE